MLGARLCRVHDHKIVDGSGNEIGIVTSGTHVADR